MTPQELRETHEYKKCVEKITSYPEGFEFNIHYLEMRKGQANAMRIILKDCIHAGLIKSISFDLNLNMDITQERFRRL